jgi:hypothetical protein
MSVVVNGVSDHVSNRVDPPTVDNIHVVVNGVSDHAPYRAFDWVAPPLPPTVNKIALVNVFSLLLPLFTYSSAP